MRPGCRASWAQPRPRTFGAGAIRWLWCCRQPAAYHRLNRTLGLETRLMPMDSQEIARLIKARFPDAEVTIRDLAGDGDHYAAHVVSKEFKGKTRVQQHKMVYDALEGRMGGVLHALALTTAPRPD